MGMKVILKHLTKESSEIANSSLAQERCEHDNEHSGFMKTATIIL